MTGENAQYLGLIIDYKAEDLEEDSFITLAPGETAEALVNIPALCKSPLYMASIIEQKLIQAP